MAGAVVRRLLEPRSIAVVGAGERPGSFGRRLVSGVLSSPAGPRVYLVNPRHREVLGHPCLPSLADVPEPVDLVVLGVPDAVLVDQVKLAGERGDGAAVVFGSAHGVTEDLAAAAGAAGMALCGAGCMGFVNPARGIRAIGYLERDPLPVGPIALVTHSGSVFSALLRSHRRLEFSLAVSSGQELVTPAAAYLDYALDLPETRVIGLFLEAMRDAPALRSALARAEAADVPVVALTVGVSEVGRAMVGAHSGALLGEQGAWEALFDAHGVHRTLDFAEFVDTLELFAVGRRCSAGAGGTVGGGGAARARGIATVHDSGGERALTADAADRAGVRFATLSDDTLRLLANEVEEGIAPANPLDVWGTGARTEELFTACLTTLAADDAVDVVALSVDLVEEYDGDESYPEAALAVHCSTDKPVVVLSAVAAAVDQVRAGRLREAGVPVLEGLTSGMAALHHLLVAAEPRRPAPTPRIDEARAAGWRAVIAGGPVDAATLCTLLVDYGLEVAPTVPASSAEEARAAAASVGYPVVLKTSTVAHKTDVDGVVLGLADPSALIAAYDEMAGRLGSEVLIQPRLPAGVEVALGIVRDPHLGPLVLVAAGGALVELVHERAVALPPLDHEGACRLLDRLPKVGRLLDGVRGRPPADRDAVLDAIVALGGLALELGDGIGALDLNPLVCTPTGAVVVDALLS
ncbi:MAG: acetate--CoA ligase family protein [Nocardioidaceae bacterium]